MKDVGNLKQRIIAVSFVKSDGIHRLPTQVWIDVAIHPSSKIKQLCSEEIPRNWGKRQRSFWDTASTVRFEAESSLGKHFLIVGGTRHESFEIFPLAKWPVFSIALCVGRLLLARMHRWNINNAGTAAVHIKQNVCDLLEGKVMNKISQLTCLSPQPIWPENKTRHCTILFIYNYIRRAGIQGHKHP